jgi:Zn-dependent protease with chaperone function
VGSPFISFLAAAVFALVPAALSLWWGRALARHVADPALPERLYATARKRGFAVAFCLTLLLLVAPGHFVWAAALQFVAQSAANYPLRRAIYRETWSIGAYLSFFIRLFVGAYGFWLLLAGAPAIAGGGAPYEWIVGGVLAAILLAFYAKYHDILRWLLRAKPVDDPVLVSRFGRLVETSQLPPPRFERVDLHGGVFANAAALPGIRRSTVVFTSTLLERLNPDEIEAICAHELAHLEHYNAARLRRLSAVAYGLIITAALLTPLFRVLFGSTSSIVTWVWAGGLLVGLAVRGARRKKHETESDLRAVALTGNAEALASALVKLHAIAHVPRRWDSQFEKQATHPSLARRVQAIRAAAGVPPASLGEAATFSAADGKSSMVFFDDRLQWDETGTTTHTVAYSHLDELRVDASRSREPHLVAVDRNGFRWEIALRADDVARAQAVLDIVDARLGAPAAREDHGRAMVGATVAAAAFLAAVVGQLGALLAIVLAFGRPAAPLLAAAAAAAVASGLLTWRDRVALASVDLWPVLSAALLLLGFVLIGIARAKRHDEIRPGVSRLVAVLGGAAILAFACVLMSAGDVIRVHQAARQWPSALVLSGSLAAAMAFWPIRAVRYASIPVGLVAIALGVAGSMPFLERFGRDPFLAPADPISLRSISGDPLAEFTVPFTATDLRVSPTGRYIALLSEREDETTELHVRAPGGLLTRFDASDGVFVDDSRLLLVHERPDGSVLSEVALATPPRQTWEEEVPGMWAAHLTYGRATKRWRLIGSSREQIALVEGLVGSGHIEQHRWRRSEDDAAYSAVPARGSGVLIVQTVYEGGLLDRGPLWRWAFLLAPGTRVTSRLRVLADDEADDLVSSRMALTCGGSLADERSVCAAFDGTRTRLFAVDTQSRGIGPLGRLEGRFWVQQDSEQGWIAGWSDGTMVALRLATREGFHVDAPDGQAAYQLAVGESVLGALFHADGTTVRLYSLE